MRGLAMIGIFSLTGCAMTLPVNGMVEGSGEHFVGQATGHLDGAGELTMKTERGTTCTGRFVYVNPREGSGTFHCSDGRSGPFTFVSTGHRGTGTGTLNGQNFTFTFG
jgi:hypothetical protein